MTEADKDQVRVDRRAMSACDVARKHKISRQYVYLIVAQPPDEAKRALERAFGVEEEPSSFDDVIRVVA